MSAELRLSEGETARLRAVAETLVPGDGNSPSAADTPELDRLLEAAAVALGVGFEDLQASLRRLPEPVEWTSLRALSDTEPETFELITSVAVGAYFMSADVLHSLGYPTGARSAAPFDLAASELETGILEPVLSAGSRLRPA